MDLINKIKKITRRKLGNDKYYADELYSAYKVFLLIDKDENIKYDLSVVDTTILTLGEDNKYCEIVSGKKFDSTDPEEIREKVMNIEKHKVRDEFVIYPNKSVYTSKGDHYGILTKEDIINGNYIVDQAKEKIKEYNGKSRR